MFLEFFFRFHTEIKKPCVTKKATKKLQNIFKNPALTEI